MEIIVNISLLMLAAILLIGFTMTKIHEKNIIEEKVRYGKEMTRDVHAVIEFVFRNKKEISLSDPSIHEEIREFIRVYTKEKGFHDFLIADRDLRIIGSRKLDLIGQISTDPFLQNAVRLGQFQTRVETSGGFLWTRYDQINLYSPLWTRGKIAGAFQIEVPIGDVMVRLVRIEKNHPDRDHFGCHRPHHFRELLIVSRSRQPFERFGPSDPEDQRRRFHPNDRSHFEE